MVKIGYMTTNESLAINWLKPSQTAGKKLPYLFTQCESIACRSLAPMQDTPAIKITYEAHISVKSEFVVKASANETGIEHFPHKNITRYNFHNQIKMPSYLIAIAVGDLVYRPLGRRVGVITEPSQIDAVAWELESLETLLDETEKYLTPYIWGNYSILILPPSFPFGGMENPLLTFASPTIITGDKSQVYVATHEIAHSWTGNDVTCENWENFWINEGFTVFEERKISGKLHGKDFA
jgi:leukotriene-A4 hydrolase